MIKEIDENIYEQNNVIPMKTRKEIEKYRQTIERDQKVDILSKSEPWEIYQYFEEVEGDTRSLIKKGKDGCMVTTMKEGFLPHVDIVQYGEDDDVESLTSIDICEDGFDHMVKRNEDVRTIRIYKQRGNKGIELTFDISALLAIFPMVEVIESPKHHTISYTLADGIGKKPTSVTLLTGRAPVKYMRGKDEEDYRLIDSGIFKSLESMFSKRKTKTLQEVEEEFGAKYTYEDELSDKFKKASQIVTQGIKLPQKLQALLNRLPNFGTISNPEEKNRQEKTQENGKKQKEADYIK